MDAASLSGIKIFNGLSDAELREIARPCSWKRYDRGQTILAEKDQDNDVYFIIYGEVRATVYSPQGTEVIFRDIEAGDFFGEYSAIDGAPRSADVKAKTDTLVASMPSSAFIHSVARHPGVSEAIMRRFVRQIRALSERVFEFSALTVKYRIHRELLRLAMSSLRDDSSAVIEPAPTHSDLASRIATHREAVSRELSALGRKGIVLREGHSLMVPDVSRLQELVEGAFS